MNNQDTYIEEKLKEFDEKISDHTFNGNCCYNDNEGGKGHIDCRYPFNPGRENPSGEQCLKLKEEHFDLRSTLTTLHSTIIEDLRKGIEEKVTVDLNNGLFYRISSNEQTFTKYILSLLPSKQESKQEEK